MAISWQWTAVMVVASALVICTPGFVSGTTGTDFSCALILCLSPSRCENGKCILICETPGTADCNGDFGDGCEVNTMNDVSNCAGCGHQCPKPKNDYEFATCQDGRCKNLDNCAFIRCAAYANAVTTCSQGRCRVKCLPGFADCDGDLQTNGCEVKLNEDVKNCGQCKRQCPNPHPYGTPGLPKCKNGKCV